MSDSTDLVREITEYLEQVSRTGIPDEIRAERGKSAARLGVHPRGKLASWILAAFVIAAFTAGGVALITHLWWLFGVSAAVVIGAVPTGKAVGIMDDAVVTAPLPRRRTRATRFDRTG